MLLRFLCRQVVRHPAGLLFMQRYWFIRECTNLCNDAKQARLFHGWLWSRISAEPESGFQWETGFSLLIRNSFWTACYYLWPLDVWIDLQALGPGHCVGHVWRRSWPLCVCQGPQISCPPLQTHTHTHTHTTPPFAPPITSTLWTKAYRTHWCFAGF